MPPRRTKRCPNPIRPMRAWACATRAATTTSWAPACCRSKTSSTAASAPSAACAPAGGRRLRRVGAGGGMWEATRRLLDVFLLHCLLSDSPPDTPEEIAELQHNQQLTAECGREPGLRLQRNGHSLPLTDWGAELLAACAPLAAALDASHGSDDYGAALHA